MSQWLRMNQINVTLITSTLVIITTLGAVQVKLLYSELYILHWFIDIHDKQWSFGQSPQNMYQTAQCCTCLDAVAETCIRDLSLVLGQISDPLSTSRRWTTAAYSSLSLECQWGWMLLLKGDKLRREHLLTVVWQQKLLRHLINNNVGWWNDLKC